MGQDNINNGEKRVRRRTRSTGRGQLIGRKGGEGICYDVTRRTDVLTGNNENSLTRVLMLIFDIDLYSSATTVCEGANGST